VLAAVEEYLAAQRAGQPPDRAAFLARHAALAPALAECLDGLDFIEEVGPGLKQLAGGLTPGGECGPAERLLGDFRLLREVGRGGMGIVNEAEQVSLRRPVALKVLPFAAALDERQLRRFKNEAQAAAGLHYTNIVPVYGVGCERGVYYYAMQFIDGQTLAELIAELRQRARREASTEALARAPEVPAAAEAGAQEARPAEGSGPGGSPTGPCLLPALSSGATGSGAAVPPFVRPCCPPGAPALPPAETVRRAAATLATECTSDSPLFFRTAARLGVQAAEALEHAHQRDITHRDIKPGNLMVDRQGHLWVTDFGLAHVQGQAGLTMTGDLVGTLRYMSPEQALAKRVPIDHRADVYSLGATLYELLTLEPAFRGRDRQELLRQIAFDEPRPPRKLNRAIPAELETVVLKAMAKSPAERYGTAQELADDLRRFLEDKPIRAKRPTALQRARKWVRRHPGVAWMAAVLLVVLAVGSAVSTVLIARQRDLAEVRREEADNERTAAVKAREVADKARNRAEQAEAEARREEAKAEAINRFLVEDLLAFGNGLPFGPYRESNATVAQVLQEAVRTVDKAFPGQPELEASVRLTLGHTFFRLRMYKEAEPQLRRALELRGNALAEPSDPWSKEYAETVFAMKARGLALRALGRPAEAEPLLRQCRLAGRRTELRRIPCGGLNVLTVAFSPDGRWLLAGGDEPSLHLYDVTTGNEVHQFDGHDQWVYSLAFSPDGRLALSGGEDEAVLLWDVATAKKLRQFARGHAGAVTLLTFSPDGRRALSAGIDKVIRIWDVRSGEEVRRLRGQPAGIAQVVFSPDGRRVLSAGADGTIRRWDVETGAEIPCLQKAGAPVTGVALSTDGRRALSADNASLLLWDVETGQELHRIAYYHGFDRLALTPGGRRALGSLASVVFLPDGHHALSSDAGGGKLRLWDLDTGKVKCFYLEPPLHPNCIRVSPDGRLAASGNWRGSVSLWRLGEPPLAGEDVTEARGRYETQRRERGPDHSETVRALEEWAALLRDDGRLAEAESLFRRGLECRRRTLGLEHPETVCALKQVALLLEARSKPGEAEALRLQAWETCRRTLGADHPDTWQGLGLLVHVLEVQGKQADARRRFPEYYRARQWQQTLARGAAYAERGAWDKAAADYADAFAKEAPSDPMLWFEHACLLARVGDAAGYRKLCRRMRARFFGVDGEGRDVIYLAHACVLAADALDDPAAVIELAELRWARTQPPSGHHPWSAHIMGLACYRAGQYQKAIDWLNKELAPAPNHDWLVLAMAHQRLGHASEARRRFDQAARWIDEAARKRPKDRAGVPQIGWHWRDWLMAELLRREAEALLTRPAAGPQAREMKGQPQIKKPGR
jgi:serine/threonine protein kinase